MDIDAQTTIRWSAPNDRTDGTAIRGNLGYHLEFDAGGVVTRYPSIGGALLLDTEFAFTPADIGLTPGNYTLYVRATEDYQGTGRVSGRSNGIPFPLERIAPPSPPYGLDFAP